MSAIRTTRSRRAARLAATAAALALVAPAGASAKGIEYVGKTKEGSKVTFVRDGVWIKQIKTLAPMNCVSAQGGQYGRLVLWWPPFNFRLGVTAKAVEKSTSSPTKNHSLKTHLHGTTITGTLASNWSVVSGSSTSDLKIFECLMTGSFTARPKR